MILAIYYAPATNVLLHKSNILDIERRYEDHDGLGCDGSHRTDV